MRHVGIAVLLAVFLLAVVSVGQAQTTTPAVSVSPVVLVPFTTAGFEDAQAGVSLSLHLIPTSATNKMQDWAAQHVTLEIPCIGSQVDKLKAGLGVALNLQSAEKVTVKGGLCYISTLKKPAMLLGISIPL